MVQLKRIYDEADDSDGTRILVDRLWPRGMTKAKAKLDRWERDLAPSTELRKWFAHDPVRWSEFQRRYRDELKDQTGKLGEIAEESQRGAVTLVYAAKDLEHNEAVVLKAILDACPS